MIGFCLLKLVLVPNFSLKWQFRFFWSDLPKKGFSGLKQKKWTPHIFYKILHIQTSLVQNFSSNWQFLFFGSNLHKKLFPIKNSKSEHDHIEFWIFKPVFWYKISAITDNFDFLTRFVQKRFFWSKTGKVNTRYFLHNCTYSN